MRDVIERYDSAMRMALEVFELGQRRSGRTTRLIDAAQPGDKIVLPVEGGHGKQELHRLGVLLREAGKDKTVKITVTPLFEPPRGRNVGRPLLDHSFVHAHYAVAIADAGRWLRTMLERETAEAEAYNKSRAGNERLMVERLRSPFEKD